MPKLEQITPGTFTINGVPYQSGEYEIKGGGDLIGIGRAAVSVQHIAHPVNFGEWTDSADNPYVSRAVLITDLQSFMFI